MQEFKNSYSPPYVSSLRESFVESTIKLITSPSFISPFKIDMAIGFSKCFCITLLMGLAPNAGS